MHDIIHTHTLKAIKHYGHTSVNPNQIAVAFTAMFKNSQSSLCLIACNQLHSTWLYIHQIITNRHKNRKLWTKTTVPILYSLSQKQDYCSHPMFSLTKTGLLFPFYVLSHKNRTTVPILCSLSWKQDYCSHPKFSVMKTGLLFPSYILCHENRTTVPTLYSLSWKQDYCSHPIFSVMKTGLLFPSYLSWKQDYCSHPIFSVMKTGLLFPSYILCHENRTTVPIL